MISKSISYQFKNAYIVQTHNSQIRITSKEVKKLML